MPTSNNRGARDSHGRKKPPVFGKYTDARVAWVDLGIYQTVIYDGESSGTYLITEREYDYDPIKLVIRKSRSKQQILVDLTFFTEEELNTFRSIVEKACDLAKPICQKLDQLAKEAYENGDDSFTRLYRSVPELHERERKSRKQREGLLDRPSDALDGSGTDRGLGIQPGDSAVPDPEEGDA